MSVTFTQVLFLLGAAAVIGPILAHLLARPRYRRIPFTMLRFLRIGQTEMQSRRAVRNLLMLLLRCLVIVLIAALFAGPRLARSVSEAKAGPAWFLGLDDSLSMAYTDGDGTYLERMVERARAWIDEAPHDATFSVYLLASGRRVESVSRIDALTLVGKTEPVAASAQLTEFLDAVRAAKAGGAGGREVCAFLAGDFTPAMRETLTVDEPIEVDEVRHELIVSDGPIDNVLVSSAHVAGLYEDGRLRLCATVASGGEVDRTTRLAALIDGREIAGSALDLAPGQRRNIHLELPPEAVGDAEVVPIELRLTAGDGLAADDAYYLPVVIPKAAGKRVLLVGEDDEDTFLLRTAFATLMEAYSREFTDLRTLPHQQLSGSALETAEVVICTCASHLGSLTPESVREFLGRGGRLVAFVKRSPQVRSVEPLLTRGLAPAAPDEFCPEPAELSARPETATVEGFSSPQSIQALCNYKIERTVLTGCYRCRPADDALCAWRFANGNGFIYVRTQGRGAAVLVNTSADDSLGSLMKSPAAPAFCRYLAGESLCMSENVCLCGEPFAIPASPLEIRCGDQLEKIWVAGPDGKNLEVVLSGGNLVAVSPLRTGWVRTLAKPVRYAGLNVADGETNLEKPNPEAIATAMAQMFRTAKPAETQGEAAPDDRENRPLWRWLAWGLIGLLLLEPAIANRIKR